MENPEVDRELASDETPDPIAISAEPKEEGHSSQKELLLEGQKQGLLQNVKNFFTGKDENRVSTLTPRPHPRRQWQDPQELEDALHKAEQATRQCRKLQIDLVAYKKHCKSLKESLNSSDQVAEAQLGQIARYQDEHTRLSSEIAVLEQWRRETQEKEFRRAEESSWPTDSDETIRKRMGSLEKACQTWARQHAAPQPRMADFERKDVPMHDGEGVDNVAGLQFDSFLKLTDQCQPPPELGSIPEKAPRLLLSAALSHYLYNNVIFRPFYFLDYRGGGKSERQVCQLISEFVAGNGAQASKWRAELLRQLYPQDQTDSEYGEQGRAMLEMTKKATERAIQLSLSASLDNFLQMAKPLMSTSTAVNIETLQRMFSDASNISIAIWTQLRRFQLVDFSFLPQSFGDALQIMPETPLIEAHAMHTAVLEDDERCMDARQPLLLTTPGMIAYGDSAGTDYTISCVLKTAVAWMGPN